MTEPLPGAVLHLFVYGTLKRGFGNHRRYFGPEVSVRKASVTGRLYLLDASYPALEIPPEHVLAWGGEDYTREVSMLVGSDWSPPPTVDGWGQVHGEVLITAEPEAMLKKLDDLEDYLPGRPNNLYERVLVPVCAEGIEMLAWTYVQRPPIRGRLIPGGVWPER